MKSAKGIANWGLLAVVTVIALLVVGGIFRGTIRRPQPTRTHVFRAGNVSVAVASKVSPIKLGDFQNGFASVIDPALSAVVNISSTKTIRQQRNYPFSPFSRQFFDHQFGPPSGEAHVEREYSLGSGVIINSNGYILTNNHVIAGGSDIEVSTKERERFKATVVGTDARTDIAVLKISASGLPTLTLGNSSDMKVGDIVFAIGDPFGIGETATMGIVSATGRDLGGAIEHYEDFIQTDAAINPGNSGGALIDANGDLIGINTAIITGGQGIGNDGIGFAIPMNMARDIMEQILQHGRVIRGYLGISSQAVTPQVATEFGLSHGGGALIGDVTASSPAAKAGLERGDIILQLNGNPVSDADALSVDIAEMAPGSVAHLQVYRNREMHNVDVTLGEYAESRQATQQPPPPAATGLKGLQVYTLTPNIARELNLPPLTKGVVVTDVDPLCAAAAAGIQEGDVIEEINHTPVQNIDEYHRESSQIGNQPALLLINRAGVTQYAVVGGP